MAKLSQPKTGRYSYLYGGMPPHEDADIEAQPSPVVGYAESLLGASMRVGAKIGLTVARVIGFFLIFFIISVTVSQTYPGTPIGNFAQAVENILIVIAFSIITIVVLIARGIKRTLRR